MTEIFDRRRLQSQVRIWRGDVPIGSGFVVGKEGARYVMTCAHVVGDSAGKRAELKGRAEPPVDLRVRMDMPIASGRFFDGRVVPAGWRPEGGSNGDGLDDVALLEIVEGELPRAALPVGKTRSVRERDWIVGYGVAAKLPDGVAIGGRVQAIFQNRFLITAEEVDAAVRPGCSGAAAWHSQGGGVAGMIAEMQQTQTGRVIPIDLLEQVCELAWEDEIKPPLPPEPAPAALELDGLKALATMRATRDLVVTYGVDIRRTSECANAVGDLKRLHDLVDQLRRTVYVPLRSIVQRLPAPEAFRDVAQQRSMFLDLRSKIVSIASPPRFDEGEFPWVDEQLADAADDLKEALEKQRQDLVAAANENLRQVVEVELTSLDARIAEATRRLDLDTLIAKLEALGTELVESGASADQVEGLERDIMTLSQIEGRVQALISLHHDWQRLDSHLNGFENALSQSMDFVATSWRLLSRKLAKVCPADAPDAVPGLAEAVGTVDAAIEARDSTRLWINFPELATRLRDRFFRIDRDLLEECERIRTVGMSLSSVVEKLDGR